MNTIQIPISEVHNLALLSNFASTEPIPQWINSVMVEVGDGISGIATDRYSIAHVVIAGFDLFKDAPRYYRLSLATAKALLAIKPKRGEPDFCDFTFEDDALFVTYNGTVYQIPTDEEVTKRMPTMRSYLELEPADTITPFAMKPGHLARLVKLSKDPWQFAMDTGATPQKPAPLIATTPRFYVIIQPTLIR